MVINSKSLALYILLMITNSGNSETHGPHQVAQIFINRTLSVLFFRSSFIPASSIVSSGTGLFAHSSSFFFTHSLLSLHFVEQPKTFVVLTATSLLASRSSIAARVSCELGVFVGFSMSSMRPWYLNFLSLSKINTWGVATGPYFSEVAWVSPSYR